MPTSLVPVFCRDCAKPLSDVEVHFYETRCEQCEREWSEKVSAWRRGESVEPEDAQTFEAAFSQPRPTPH